MMTTDEKYISDIGYMTKGELLDEIMTHPEYLTDGYYRKFRYAFVKRYEELEGE